MLELAPVSSSRFAPRLARLLKVIPSPLLAASNASPPRAIWEEVCIFWSEFVPFLAAGFSKILRALAFAQHQIFVRGYWLKVLRVHAFTSTANVVNLHSFWNRPDEHLVGKSVGGDKLVVLTESPVVILAGSHPNPARRSDLDEGPESSEVRVSSQFGIHTRHYTITDKRAYV